MGFRRKQIQARVCGLSSVKERGQRSRQRAWARRGPGVTAHRSQVPLRGTLRGLLRWPLTSSLTQVLSFQSL